MLRVVLMVMMLGGVLGVSRNASASEEADAPRVNSALVPVPQKPYERRHAEKVALVQKNRYDLLMIGDSITDNFNDPAYGDIWRRFFASRNALNLGYSGARTENILWNLTHGELKGQSPKAVILLIGTNNADDANYPTVNTAVEIFEGTAAIVNLLREKLPKTHILLLRIFPRQNVYLNPDGTEKGSVQQRLSTCLRAGELVKSLADGEHVIYLDVNAVFLRSDGTIDPNLMPDLLHPSPAGALEWARVMEPELSKIFDDKPHEVVASVPSSNREKLDDIGGRGVLDLATVGSTTGK